MLLLFYTIVQCANILCVNGAALNTSTPLPTTKKPEINNNNIYNLENFDEVYDQRQNGTENYKIDVNGVILVWSPPGSLLTAASLLDPALFGDEEYLQLEDVLNQQNPSKPEEMLVVKPESPSSSTTTSLPPPSSSESSPPSSSLSDVGIQSEIQTNVIQPEIKRKFRLPGFMRPFITRRIGQK